MKDSKKVENIDDYISDFSVETQKYLNEMRELIRKLAPDSVESISYAIPTFSLNGKYLVYFAGFKNHIGSVQFPLNKPLPIALITKIVKYQIEQNEIKTKK